MIPNSNPSFAEKRRPSRHKYLALLAPIKRARRIGPRSATTPSLTAGMLKTASVEAIALDGGNSDGRQVRQRANALLPHIKPFYAEIALGKLFHIQAAAKRAP